MKKLRPFFKRLLWLLVEEELNPREQREFIDFELSYYEIIFIEQRSPMSIREALDAIDLVVLHERDDRYFADWPRMAELYKACTTYLRSNTALFEDPILGQGYYQKDRIQARYEHKRRVLASYAERQNFILV